MTAPPWLGDLAAQAWREVGTGRRIAPSDVPVVEAFCVAVSWLRDARARVDADGIITTDDKGRAQRHPALEIELAASAEMRGWVQRRPDLFGELDTAGSGGSFLDDLAKRRSDRESDPRLASTPPFFKCTLAGENPLRPAVTRPAPTRNSPAPRHRCGAVCRSTARSGRAQIVTAPPPHGDAPRARSAPHRGPGPRQR